jgi:hypothetical protein
MAKEGNFQANPKRKYKATTIYGNKSEYKSNMVLINRFALSFLWFVVEYGQKGHGHGQLHEQQLSFLLFVHKLLSL